MLTKIEISDFLSFTFPPVTVGLKELNVIIGPNGAGKSNFLDVLNYVTSVANDDMSGFLREKQLSPNQILSSNNSSIVLTDVEAAVFFLSQTKQEQKIELKSDYINMATPQSNPPSKLLENRNVIQDFITGLAIDDNAKIKEFATELASIYVYNQWHYKRPSAISLPQSIHDLSDTVNEDFSNLFLAINKILGKPELEQGFLQMIKEVIPGVQKVHIQVESSSSMLYLHIHGKRFSAAQLSDGTLRWIALAAIFYSESPGKIVCIDEPELGLHPDMYMVLAEELKKFATRVQVIITTQSPQLLDKFSDVPESVLVFSNPDNKGTQVKRIEKGELDAYLEDRSLGELWMSGHLGGVRY